MSTEIATLPTGNRLPTRMAYIKPTSSGHNFPQYTGDLVAVVYVGLVECDDDDECYRGYECVPPKLADDGTPIIFGEENLSFI